MYVWCMYLCHLCICCLYACILLFLPSYFQGGYTKLIERLTQQLRHSIRFDFVVKKINYENEGKVRVTDTNGTILTADYVIVTVPLGVLKSGSIEFSPPLPPQKFEAISNLGFGLLNKIVVEFPTAFWKVRQYVSSPILYIHAATRH